MFMGLAAEKYDRHYSDRQLVRRMAAYFAPFRRQLAVLAVLLITVTVIGLVSPLLIARGIDLVGAQPSPEGIVALCLVLLMLSVVSWFCQRLRRQVTVRLIADVVGRMREDAFNATIRHDLSFFDEYPIRQGHLPHHQRHAGAFAGDPPAFRPDQPVHHHHRVDHRLVHHLLAAHAGSVGHGADRGLPGLGVPPDRADGHAHWLSGDRRGQQRDPGVGRRHPRGQELPPGGGDLRPLPADQPTLVCGQPAARLCPLQRLPDAEHAERDRHCDHGLSGRARRARRRRLGRRLGTCSSSA